MLAQPIDSIFWELKEFEDARDKQEQKDKRICVRCEHEGSLGMEDIARFDDDNDQLMCWDCFNILADKNYLRSVGVTDEEMNIDKKREDIAFEFFSDYTEK